MTQFPPLRRHGGGGNIVEDAVFPCGLFLVAVAILSALLVQLGEWIFS